MDSIAVVKPNMTVVRQDSLSPFGLLTQVFTEELLRRSAQEIGSYRPLSLAYLEEGEEERPAAVPELHFDLDVDLLVKNILRERQEKETGGDKRKTPEQRILERVILREREIRTAYPDTRRLVVQVEGKRFQASLPKAAQPTSAPAAGAPGALRETPGAAAQTGHEPLAPSGETLRRVSGALQRPAAMTALRSDVSTLGERTLTLASQAVSVPAGGGWTPSQREEHPGYPVRGEQKPEGGVTPGSILLPDVMRRRREEALARREDPGTASGFPEEPGPLEEGLAWALQGTEQTGETERVIREVRRAVLETLKRNADRSQAAPPPAAPRRGEAREAMPSPRSGEARESAERAPQQPDPRAREEALPARLPGETAGTGFPSPKDQTVPGGTEIQPARGAAEASREPGGGPGLLALHSPAEAETGPMSGASAEPVLRGLPASGAAGDTALPGETGGESSGDLELVFLETEEQSGQRLPQGTDRPVRPRGEAPEARSAEARRRERLPAESRQSAGSQLRETNAGYDRAQPLPGSAPARASASQAASETAAPLAPAAAARGEAPPSPPVTGRAPAQGMVSAGAEAAPAQGTISSGAEAAPAQGTVSSGAGAAPAQGTVSSGAEAAQAQGAISAGAEAVPAQGTVSSGAGAAPAQGTVSSGAEAVPVQGAISVGAGAAPAQGAVSAGAEAAPAQGAVSAGAEAVPAQGAISAGAEAAPAQGTIPAGAGAVPRLSGEQEIPAPGSSLMAALPAGQESAAAEPPIDLIYRAEAAEGEAPAPEQSAREPMPARREGARSVFGTAEAGRAPQAPVPGEPEALPGRGESERPVSSAAPEAGAAAPEQRADTLPSVSAPRPAATEAAEMVSDLPAPARETGFSPDLLAETVLPRDLPGEPASRTALPAEPGPAAELPPELVHLDRAAETAVPSQVRPEAVPLGEARREAPAALSSSPVPEGAGDRAGSSAAPSAAAQPGAPMGSGPREAAQEPVPASSAAAPEAGRAAGTSFPETGPAQSGGEGEAAPAGPGLPSALPAARETAYPQSPELIYREEAGDSASESPERTPPPARPRPEPSGAADRAGASGAEERAASVPGPRPGDTTSGAAPVTAARHPASSEAAASRPAAPEPGTARAEAVRPGPKVGPDENETEPSRPGPSRTAGTVEDRQAATSSGETISQAAAPETETAGEGETIRETLYREASFSQEGMRSALPAEPEAGETAPQELVYREEALSAAPRGQEPSHEDFPRRETEGQSREDASVRNAAAREPGTARAEDARPGPKAGPDENETEPSRPGPSRTAGTIESYQTAPPAEETIPRTAAPGTETAGEGETIRETPYREAPSSQEKMQTALPAEPEAGETAPQELVYREEALSAAPRGPERTDEEASRREAEGRSRGDATHRRSAVPEPGTARAEDARPGPKAGPGENETEPSHPGHSQAAGPVETRQAATPSGETILPTAAPGTEPAGEGETIRETLYREAPASQEKMQTALPAEPEAGETAPQELIYREEALSAASRGAERADEDTPRREAEGRSRGDAFPRSAVARESGTVRAEDARPGPKAGPGENEAEPTRPVPSRAAGTVEARQIAGAAGETISHTAAPGTEPAGERETIRETLYREAPPSREEMQTALPTEEEAREAAPVELVYREETGGPSARAREADAAAPRKGETRPTVGAAGHQPGADARGPARSGSGTTGRSAEAAPGTGAAGETAVPADPDRTPAGTLRTGGVPGRQTETAAGPREAAAHQSAEAVPSEPPLPRWYTQLLAEESGAGEAELPSALPVQPESEAGPELIYREETPEAPSGAAVSRGEAPRSGSVPPVPTRLSEDYAPRPLGLRLKTEGGQPTLSAPAQAAQAARDIRVTGARGTISPLSAAFPRSRASESPAHAEGRSTPGAGQEALPGERAARAVPPPDREETPPPPELVYAAAPAGAEQTPEEAPARPTEKAPSPDRMEELPQWARELLEQSGVTDAAQQNRILRSISAPGEQAGQISWSAPGAGMAGKEASPAAVRPVELSFKEPGQPAEESEYRFPISDAELQRTADRVYRIIEERLRRELRRSGR